MKLEVLAMKQEGGFVRYELNPKYCDMQESKTSLGVGLLSAKNSHISSCINKIIMSQQIYKLLEREVIKGALNSGIFEVLPKAAVHYLQHPEVAMKAYAHAAAVVESDSDEDEEAEIAEDICRSK
ncbi:hypothetical protein R1sor_009281 [Riccia sorocarpa]|uniref:Uncharacterized protein n=1 Tax=Riccia sorocarpa TaxID=122646 RepID=A0ABD3HUM8_9MARC